MTDGDPLRAFSVVAAAQDAPHAAAVISDAGTLSFTELAERVATVRASQHERLRHTPSAASAAPNSYELNNSLLEELSYHVITILGDASLPALLELYAALEGETPALLLHPRYTEPERRRLLEAALDATRRGQLDPKGDAVLLPTSGSSGHPALVRLSRRALSASAQASAANLGWETADRWLVCLPISHAGGLSIVTRCLAARKPVVLLEIEGALSAEAIFDAVERHAVTLLSLVPTVLERMLELERPLPSAVRALLLGGAQCPPRLLARAEERGWPMLTTYGMTETASQVCTEPYARGASANVPRTLGAAQTKSRDNSRPRSVGRPLPGWELELREGSIWVRGAALMSGYLGEGAPPFDAGGWFDTGDVGRLDERGHLFVLGRADDVIISGGENVSPDEVEAALGAEANVLGACVFGVPDATWGELVCAALILEPAMRESLTGSAALGDLIRRTLDGKLARFKWPRAVALVDAFPVGPTGKLDRRQTRELAQPLLSRLETRAPA
jgi:O-succinylbenzoic acid--CoA ligase